MIERVRWQPTDSTGAERRRGEGAVAAQTEVVTVRRYADTVRSGDVPWYLPRDGANCGIRRE